jgi:hypothetical protein
VGDAAIKVRFLNLVGLMKFQNGEKQVLYINIQGQLAHDYYSGQQD